MPDFVLGQFSHPPVFLNQRVDEHSGVGNPALLCVRRVLQERLWVKEIPSYWFSMPWASLSLSVEKEKNERKKERHLTGFSLPSPLAHTHATHTTNKRIPAVALSCVALKIIIIIKKEKNSTPSSSSCLYFIFYSFSDCCCCCFCCWTFSVCVTSRCYWQAHFCIYRFDFLCYAVTFGIRRPKLGSAWMDPYPPNGSISRLPRRARPLVGGDATT